MVVKSKMLRRDSLPEPSHERRAVTIEGAEAERRQDQIVQEIGYGLTPKDDRILPTLDPLSANRREGAIKVVLEP